MTIIETIKTRLHIEDIVGHYLPLTQSGKNLRGLCPFHTEQTPSFFVFPDTQRWKCFGCGAGGDLIDFVMRREGVDLTTALRELAAQAQIAWQPPSAAEKHRLTRQREREAVFAAAAAYFHQRLGLARGEQPETGSPGIDLRPATGLHGRHLAGRRGRLLWRRLGRLAGGLAGCGHRCDLPRRGRPRGLPGRCARLGRAIRRPARTPMDHRRQDQGPPAKPADLPASGSRAGGLSQRALHRTPGERA